MGPALCPPPTTSQTSSECSCLCLRQEAGSVSITAGSQLALGPQFAIPGLAGGLGWKCLGNKENESLRVPTASVIFPVRPTRINARRTAVPQGPPAPPQGPPLLGRWTPRLRSAEYSYQGSPRECREPVGSLRHRGHPRLPRPQGTSI